MKHQALARVFAVVLAVMCLLMCANGVIGIGKTLDENRERCEYADRYEKRIETYAELDEELAGSISYEDAFAELEKLQEEHDKEASQHKTDTAMYSAEKGGNTMGADIIWELMPELTAAKKELEKGKALLAESEAKLRAAKEAYENSKPMIDALKAAADSGAQSCNQINADLGVIVGKLNELIGREPQIPAEPEAPTLPAVPEGLTEPEAPPEDADDETKAAYEQALAEYNAAVEAYGQKLTEEYEAAKKEYDETIDAAREAHDEWEKECAEIRASAAGDFAAVLTCASGLAELSAQAGQIFSAMGTDIGGGDMPSFDISAASADPGSMSNEEFLAGAGKLQGALAMFSGTYSAISGGLASIGLGIQAGEEELAAGKAKLKAGEEELIKGESQAKGQLEQIWYNLGELEKDKAELEENKIKLDKEAGILSKKLAEADELKTLENKRTSTRLILTGVKEVKDMYAETGDLVGSANKYLEAYRAETGKLYAGKMILNILAVIGGLSGFAGIPAAFEKIKKRVWLIAPVAVCLICACAADGINMALGLKQMYTALFTAIFALIQLLVVTPKAHSPLDAEQ